MKRKKYIRPLMQDYAVMLEYSLATGSVRALPENSNNEIVIDWSTKEDIINIDW